MVDRDAAAPVRKIDVTELPDRMQAQVKTYDPSETSTIGTSVLGSPEVLVDTGNLGTVSVGDVVRIISGTNVTAGYYAITSIAGAPNNVTLNASFTVGGDGAGISYEVYDALVRIEDGILYATSVQSMGNKVLDLSTNVPEVDMPLIVTQSLSAAGGAPSTGTHALGETITDVNGVTWRCVTAGTPGSWCSDPISGKVTVTDTDFVALGGVANGQVAAFTLPAGAEILGCFYDLTELFTDAAPPLGATTLSIGTAVAPTILQTAQRVDDAGPAIGVRVVNGTSLDGTNLAVFDMGGTTDFVAELTIAGGKLLNALTAGEADIYYTYIIHA